MTRMWRLLASVLLVAIAASNAQLDLSKKTCSRDHWIDENGATALLSGHVAFHEQSSGSSKCGAVSKDNMQGFEALRWALSKINLNSGTYNSQPITDRFVRGIKIGMKVHDSCNSKTASIFGAMQDFPDTGYHTSACTNNNQQIFFGIVGTSTSPTSMALNELVSRFDISQISYSATDIALSDKTKYPTFMRTIPRNTQTAQALVQLLKNLNWKYIALIHDSNSMGKESLEELRKTALAAGICITFVREIDRNEVRPEVYDNLVMGVDSTGTTGAVFLGDGEQAQLVLKAADRMGKGNLQWVLAGNEMRSPDMTSLKMAKGALFLEHHFRHVAEFENHWVSLDPNNPDAENPWFKEWWMTTYKCKLAGINYAPYNSYANCVIPSEAQRRAQFVQSRHVEPAIHAVYAFAHALKNAANALCGTPGMCNRLATLSREDFFKNYLKPVQFTYGIEERIPSLSSLQIPPWMAAKRVQFDTNGDIMDNTFGIWNYVEVTNGKWEFRPVAEYQDTRFSWVQGVQTIMYNTDRTAPLAKAPESLCPNSNCQGCLAPWVDRKYYSSDGTFYMAALFDVHETGSSPYQCGKIDNMVGIDSEAFIYALKNVKAKFPGILNGVTLGGLGLDTCSSPVATSHLMTQYLSGMSMYKAPSGASIESSSTMGYMPSVKPDEAPHVARLLKDKIQLHAAYGSQQQQILDTYPYSLAMVPSDKVMAMALVNLLTRNNWFYVQTFLDGTPHKQAIADQFNTLAREAGICVVSDHKSDGDQMEVVDRMGDTPKARVVVSFADDDDVVRLFKAIKAKNAQNDFMIISDSCNLDYTPDADGLVYIKLKKPSAQEYKDYLATVDVTTYKDNPWYKELYEARLNCYLDDNNNPWGYPKKCVNPSTTPITAVASTGCGCNWVPIITAVYATARGLHDALEHYCGVGYNGVCASFRNAPDNLKTVHQKINDQMFTTIGNHNFKFVNKYGNFDFEFDNFQAKSGQALKVGESDTDTNVVTLNTNPLRFYNDQQSWKSQCLSGNCAVCINRYLQYTYIPGDVLLGGVFPVRSKGATAFRCAPMDIGNQYQNTEAVKYAISQIEAGKAPVSLNGVKLGALMFDDCGNPVRTASLIHGTHVGHFDLTHDGQRIDVSKLKGWLSYRSNPTMSAGKVLSYNNLPLITPDATSIALRNLKEYPTLYRTVPVDDKQAYGMALLAKRLDFTYVVTVNSPSSYGRMGIDAFKKYAKQLGICIAGSYEMTTDGTPMRIMNDTMQYTTKVVVVFAEKPYVRQLLEAKKAVGNPNMVFIGSEDWNNDKSVVEGLEDVAQNALTFKIESPPIAGFTEWMKKKTGDQYVDDPWFEEWYQLVSQCRLPNNGGYNTACVDIATRSAVDSGRFQQSTWTLSTMNAVYSYVHALNSVLKDLCGVNYNGVCDAFKHAPDVGQRLIDALANATFTDPSNDIFKFINREGNKGYRIYRYDNRAYSEVGKYDHVATGLTTSSFLYSKYTPATPASCVGTCTKCRSVDVAKEVFSYIPGDLLIGGMFDVHNTGNDPFSCGGMSERYGFQLVEAFNFAIDQINQRKGIFADRSILSGTTIGGIAFDSCKSGTRAGNLLANVHSGLYSLNAPDGTKISSQRIEAYVGGLKNDISIRMARLLNVLSIPQISYGSTSMLLKDRMAYPYFFRTVPADDKQARGFVSFLKAFNLKYVQVVSSPGSYGAEAAKEFIRIAPSHGICVSQHVMMNETQTPESAAAAVSQLVLRPKASLIVLFLESSYVRLFLNAANRNVNAGTNFRYVGSDEWGLDDEILAGTDAYKKMINESATFEFETADLPEFDEYLKTKTIANYQRNPWLPEYYELTFQCNLPGRSSGYSKECAQSTQSVVLHGGYKQDPYVLYVVNAVYSAAMGLHRTLLNLCGVGYSGPCASFRNSGERRQAVKAGIQGVKFQDATKQGFSFDENHESSRGYHIYNIKQNKAGQKKYFYENVGSYNDTHLLKIYSDYQMIWTSNCIKSSPSDTRCQECPDIVKQPTRYMQVKSAVDLNLLGFFDVHKQGEDQYRCGNMSTSYGFQNMLAFFYAIEKINMNEGLKLAPSVKFGGLAIDTCSSSIRARNDAWTYLGGQGFCGITADGLIDHLSIMAIVPMGSETTMALNEVTSSQEITMVSPSATSPTLNDKDVYTHTMRTVPPDTLQAEAIAAYLKRYGHSYIQVIQTDIEPDRRSAEKLLQTNASQLCIANRIIIKANADYEEIKNRTLELTKNNKAKIVVVLAEPGQARQILKSLKEMNLAGKFLLVGHSSWADLREVTEGYEDVALGSVTLKIRSEPVPEFIRWVADLNFNNRKGIPMDWFEEFWQLIHKCRDIQSKFQQYQFDQLCTRNEDITTDMISMDPFVYHTIISIYEIAKGINAIPECQKIASQDVYDCVVKLEKQKEKIYKQILETQWKVPFDSRNLTFKFTSDRYGDIGYYFYQYIRNTDPANTGPEYQYVRIGRWQEKLDMEKEPIGYSPSGERTKTSFSICPVDDKCNCVNTNAGNGNGNNGQTSENKQDYWNTNKRSCAITEEEEVKNFGEAWGIVVVAFSGLGALICCILLIYLCVAYPIRGGTSVLGFFVLVGLILLFLLNVAFVYLPSFDICGIRRFGQGFVYAFIFAPLLLKVLNAWRVGNDDTDKYKNLSHPVSLFFIAVFLVLVQVGINTEWLILRPPYVDYTTDGTLCRCAPHDFHNEGLVLSCVYVMLLLFLTALFGFVTYDNELNHREARWVLITALFTIGCWIVWTIVSTLADYHFRDPTIAIANLVNGYIILGCIFIRKMWLLSRYQKDYEEEKKSQYAASRRADEVGDDTIYHNVYNNSAYDNVESPHSRHSGDFK